MPATTLPQLFEQQVIRTPHNTALIFGNTELSYTQLNTRANQLAHLLIQRGVGPEQFVALALPRSIDMITAILAVLKTGAAYLPLDPDYPPARIAFMLQDAAPTLLVTSTITALPPTPGLPRLILDQPHMLTTVDHQPDTNPTDTHRTGSLAPAHPAYLIYTSGSTGTPKAVVVSHAGIPSLAAMQIDRFAVGPGSRVLQFASPSFDAAAWEMCMALLSGAALVVAVAERLLPSGSLADLIIEQGVTHITLPPAALAVLPIRDNLLQDAILVVAGEACSAELVARWSPERRLINAYGPTETTVCATMSTPLAEVTNAPPIGRPMANTRVFVLDSGLQPAPVGIPGELYVA
ncbi:MAG: AMP-binding protein, partial [Actinobacteria bacterium]|nr:AMP-binding protein [Actinomycetota bacterium]